MNERIKELAEHAGFKSIHGYDEEFELFAELIRLDETKACAKHYLEIMRDAVEQAVLKEREANAKLCEGKTMLYGSMANKCAAAIRQRGEQP
jgi:hypothetical protein